MSDCSICNFLRDEIRAFERSEHYPYPRTNKHRKGLIALARQHYHVFHPNPFEEGDLFRETDKRHYN